MICRVSARRHFPTAWFSQELLTIDEVLVNITDSGEKVCDGSITTRVTFPRQYGSLSNMTVDIYTLESSASTPYLGLVAKGQVTNGGCSFAE